MKKIIFSILVFWGITLPLPSYAGTWHGAKITHVYPLANGDFVLRFDADHSACTSAESPDYYRVSVGEYSVTQEGADKMYAAALAAAISGKSVSIYFDESSSFCFINRLQVVI